MMDLSQHRQTEDWTWIEEEAQRIGYPKILEIYNSIFALLNKLPVGKYFSITLSAKPENYNVVIKACCEYILFHPEYEFNNLYTRIHKNENVKMDFKRSRVAQTKCTTAQCGQAV